MFVRYHCRHCGEWHPLSDIPTGELPGAWFEFVMCSPPAPFEHWVWDILINAEIARRHGKRFRVHGL